MYFFLKRDTRQDLNKRTRTKFSTLPSVKCLTTVLERREQNHERHTILKTKALILPKLVLIPK